MKNKLKKMDYINILILCIIMAIFILLLTNGGYLLGSNTDWTSQHVPIPEFFRTLFLENKDLFPDFAFNLGSGQNIYNFAYYGLLNPVIMLSYVFPGVNMINYIMVSTSILVLSSVILFYLFLRKHDFSSELSLTSSIIFMCASPLLFHMHRHIMFINYMPFLILGLFGIDKYFDNKKSWLLVLSTFLMILMSYYYSVVGIIVFVIYGVYRYIELNKKITFKSFMIDGIKYLIPIFIGVLMSAILIVPTFLVILSSRGDTSVVITLKDLIIPNINLNYIMYNAYGVGLTSILVLALVHLFSKKRENKFLAIVLSLIIIFPICNYIFNATMYIDAKSLIPFLPLYVLVIANFIKDLFDKKIDVKLVIIGLIILFIGVFTLDNKKWLLLIDVIILLINLLLYYKINKKIIFTVLIGMFSFISSLFISKNDDLAVSEKIINKDYFNQQEIIKYITENDNGLYRISNEITPLNNTNRVYDNINYYKTTLYSSTYNLGYNKFYYDTMNNTLQNRNRVITSTPRNYLFLLLSGNKYIVNKSDGFIGYEKYITKDNINVYKNLNVLPLAFASSNLYSLDDFNMLNYPYNQDVILNNIIVDKDVNNSYKTYVEKVNLNINSYELNGINIETKDNYYLIDLDKASKMYIDIEDLNNKVLFLRFNVLESNSCDEGDLFIEINGITNKLTCESWKYHNGNYTFDYVFAKDSIKDLNIKFSKGTFKINNIETFILNEKIVSNLNKNVDEFVFDKEKTKGDIIEGDINVTNDGYFVLSVPYDKGFTVYLDNKKINYEKVNTTYLGFPIEKGSHHIKIEYTAPGKNIGTIVSISGIILYIGLIIFEEKRGKINERRNIKK